MSEVPEQGKRGRPPKLTPQVRDDILKWLRAGLPLTLAAELAGTHESTVRAWRNYSRKGTTGYKGFDDEVNAARAEGEAVNVAKIAAAGKTNWRAAAWLLERVNPDRWGPPPPPMPIPDAPPLFDQSHIADDQSGL